MAAPDHAGQSMNVFTAGVVEFRTNFLIMLFWFQRQGTSV